MTLEATISLKRALLTQRSRLVVTADGVTVELRGWGRVFRTPWFIPRSQIAVVDPAVERFDLRSRPGWVWAPAVVVPELKTGNGRVNLRLLFRTPQRLPVVRWGSHAALSAGASRSDEGLNLDGVELTAKDPQEAVHTLQTFGYELTDSPLDWLRHHHGTTRDPGVVAAVERSGRRRGRFAVVSILVWVAVFLGIHLLGDSTLDLVIVVGGLAALFGGDRLLNRYLDRRDREDAVG